MGQVYWLIALAADAYRRMNMNVTTTPLTPPTPLSLKDQQLILALCTADDLTFETTLELAKEMQDHLARLMACVRASREASRGEVWKVTLYRCLADVPQRVKRYSVTAVEDAINA